LGGFKRSSQHPIMRRSCDGHTQTSTVRSSWATSNAISGSPYSWPA
jgi:hypothetical protein